MVSAGAVVPSHEARGSEAVCIGHCCCLSYCTGAVLMLLKHDCSVPVILGSDTEEMQESTPPHV